jgi:hypothetical protein
MILLVLPILGALHVIARWLPSALVNAPVDILNGTHQLGYFWPAFVVSAVPSAAALAAAVKGLNARESLTLDRAHRGVADAHG